MVKADTMALETIKEMFHDELLALLADSVRETLVGRDPRNGYEFRTLSIRGRTFEVRMPSDRMGRLATCNMSFEDVL